VLSSPHVCPRAAICPAWAWLQHLTRRLHTWRGEFGDETSLNLRLGAAMAGSGGIVAAATSVASTVGV
jgi:acyl-CoA dehydrogenase